jgi:hypothetical protein
LATVEKLRKDTADEAAKIARDEAAARKALQERMEQGNLRREGEMKAALAELDAKFENAKKAAYLEAQKLLREQLKLQKMVCPLLGQLQMPHFELQAMIIRAREIKVLYSSVTNHVHYH